MTDSTSAISATPPPANTAARTATEPKVPQVDQSKSVTKDNPSLSSGLADRESAVAALNDVTEDIREAMVVLNETLSFGPTSASISKDNELNTFVVRIFDDTNGEIIREIPNEAMQRFARNLKEIQGLIFDKKM
jgi:flagellar protein FlaG